MVGHIRRRRQTNDDADQLTPLLLINRTMPEDDSMSSEGPKSGPTQPPTSQQSTKPAKAPAPNTQVPDSSSHRSGSAGGSGSKTDNEMKMKSVSGKRLDLLEFIRTHLTRGKKAFRYEAWQLEQLTELAKKSFQQQGTLVETCPPINLCGDIHGHYSDLIRIFHACGPPHKERYLFLGDYVDRGRHSLEVISLLLACKVQFPEHIILLRGNHELEHINRLYGFLDEVIHRFGYQTGERLWQRFNDVFSYMPLAATVGGRILCMHGGISPHLKSLDDIRRIERPIPQVITPGLVQDLLWSDPKSGLKGYAKNEFRNCSVAFGEDALLETLRRIKIDVVYRAHQCCQFGFTSFADRHLYTIFSTVRYHPDLCNWSAVIKVGVDGTVSRTLLKPKEFDEVTAPPAAEEQQQNTESKGNRRSC